MRRFLCPHCSEEVHFNSKLCLECESILGYLPLQDKMVTLESDTAIKEAVCANRSRIGCNWLCENGSQSELCLSCLHTTKIPNISDNTKREQWGRLERAKRRLFYTLIKLGLPLERQQDTSKGALHFELLGDEVRSDGKKKRIMTGHNNGRITINIDEADDLVRERNRTTLGEPYRTLIGHFRHEIAHYYWDNLVAGSEKIHHFRSLFGDETLDYSNALKVYYANGPLANWQQTHVSGYASAHPWEDFAETWAHYFHMVAGLEAAYAYGLNPQPLDSHKTPIKKLKNPFLVSDLDDLIEHWIPLTQAMNAMNRSMGNRDYYPFTLTTQISEKLKFVHDLIEENSEKTKPSKDALDQA